MSFKFRPGVSEDLRVLLGIAGPSGGGKTFSALRVATGLAQGGKIHVIDTESRRALHYARAFKFYHAELGAPFTSERYMEAINDAVADGAAVVIVDSMSHEHEGPGGILDQHEAELERIAGQDWAKRERVTFTAWIKPKASHDRFVNNVLQAGVHMIFCFRAKDKMTLVKNARGKLEPVSLGWQPICSSRFEYEMTSLLILPPRAGGAPDLKAQAYKFEDEHRAIFEEGQPLSEETGKALAKWAGAAPSRAAAQPASEAPASPPGNGNGHGIDALQKAARAAAALGTENFRAYWKDLSKPQRAALNPIRESVLKPMAFSADQAGEAVGDEDPFGLAPSPGEDSAAATTPEAEAEPATPAPDAPNAAWLFNDEAGKPQTFEKIEEATKAFATMVKSLTLPQLEAVWADNEPFRNALKETDPAAYVAVDGAYERRRDPQANAA